MIDVAVRAGLLQHGHVARTVQVIRPVFRWGISKGPASN